MFSDPIEPPALIGLKNPGAGVAQRNYCQASERQKQAEGLAKLEKKSDTIAGWQRMRVPRGRNLHPGNRPFARGFSSKGNIRPEVPRLRLRGRVAHKDALADVGGDDCGIEGIR